MNSRKGISNIIAVLLMIALAVAGAALYYSIANSYLRPQVGLSADVTISVGASGFTAITVNVVNVGEISFKTVTVDISGGSPLSTLYINYLQPISAGGGKVNLIIQGISGGSFAPVPPNPSIVVTGSVNAIVGNTYAVAIHASLMDGGTYGQTFSVQAVP